MVERLMIRLRIDEELRDRLRREAKFNRRSLNAEILHRLQLSLDGTRGPGDVGEVPGGYAMSDGEIALLTKLRNMGGRSAATAAEVIDALSRVPEDDEAR